MTKLKFFLNNKITSWLPASFSVAASWIWAPALFVSASIAYTNGLFGFLWFLVPNVLCLLFFGVFIQWVRNNYDQEHTLGTLIKEKLKSSFVHKLYVFEMLALAICSFAVQLIGGGHVIASVAGIPFWTVTFLIAWFVLSYSLFGGIKASIITDVIQYISIIIGIGVSLYYLFQIDFVFNSSIFLYGIKNLSFLNTSLTFGIPAAIGLLAGTFGDQMFWQRGYAIKKSVVHKAFLSSALLFAIVPIFMSLFGFYAQTMHLNNPNANIINFEIVKTFPLVAVVLFIIAIFSGLTSTMDSCLCSGSSVAGYDLNKSVNVSKIFMIVITILGIAIANIPGIQIVHLFLFYGTLRASVLMTTLYAFFSKHPNVIIARNAILYNLVVNVPMFAIGMIFKIKILSMVAPVANIFIPIIIYLLYKNVPILMKRR